MSNSSLPASEVLPVEASTPGESGSKDGEDSPGMTHNKGRGDKRQSNGDSSSMKDLMRVFRYNDTKGWMLNIIAVFCMIASGILFPLMDVIFGKFVTVFNNFVTGQLSPTDYRSQVNHYSLYFIYLFLGKFVLMYTWTVIINVTAIRTTKELRVAFVRQALRQEIPFFDSPSSSISGQVTTNGNLINNGISEKLGITIQATSTFVAAFVVAFAVQWKLTLIVICIVPLNIVVSIVCIYFDTIYEYRILDIYSQSASLAEEAFSTIRTAHAFWAFPKLTRRFEKILDDAAKVGKKKSLIYAILFPVEFFCIFAGYSLAFWQGMRMYAQGEIRDPGTVVTVIFTILIAAQALTQIAPQTIAISKATAAASELFAIIDRESKVDSMSADGDTIPEFNGNVSLRDVRFAYPSRPDVPVLHSLDFHALAGQTTALVGTSGSGKSTIFGLLERWYWTSHGSITLDGRSIETLNLQWLRTNIRLVQQEPTLFSGSIYQNIVDGLTGTKLADLPDEEKKALVVESCQAAFAHEFIQDLPKDYDTIIGERGASLSGGQKQRLVIARSIISNPKVLLLDEATSALDPKAEKIVQKALNNVAKGRTMIVIAHRLSTIQGADKIVVMSKGHVVEQGTHSSLIESNGVYARLVKAQDLGHKEFDGNQSEQEQEENETALEDAEKPATRVPTTVSRSHSIDSLPDAENVTHGLLRGVYCIIKEQPGLWPAFTITAVCAAAGGVTYPALAILFAKTMEAFTAVDVSKGNFFSLMFFIVAVGNAVAYAIAGWLSNVIAQKIMRFYRGEIFNNTLRQDISFFDSPSHGTGTLVSRLSAEPTSLQELLCMNIALILVNVFNLVTSSILAIASGWKLGLVLVFGALPVLVGAGYLRIRLEFDFDDDTADRFARSSALASEAVMAIRTVSSLALESAIVDRYRSTLEGIAKHSIRKLGWKMFFYSLSQSISFLAVGLGFWYGGHLVSTGEYTSGQFYLVFVAVVFSGESAATLFQYSTSITKARTSVNYILNLRRRRTMEDPHDDHGSEPSTTDEDEVSGKGTSTICEHLRFAYPLRPNLTVLKDVDISIQSGKMVAFVGASGCGKSTMIGLLERFYDPVTGRILSDGHDIKTRDRRQYRRHIALVQQEPVLYQGSIRDNISLGVEDGEPDDDAIIEACRQANVWDFICSLPQGLSTPCGNQGLSLSGGQRQRIAIARALIHQPRLLLLDEATSALDTESEKVVKEALDRAAQGRTTIAVAHRLSTIRDAHLIVVFEKGKIAQMGTHEELIAKRGIYYEMVLGQSLDREAA